MTRQKENMEANAQTRMHAPVVREPIADFLKREERAHCLKKATWKTMDMYVKWQMISKYLMDHETVENAIDESRLKQLLKSNKLRVEYDPIAKEIKNIEID